MAALSGISEKMLPRDAIVDACNDCFWSLPALAQIPQIERMSTILRKSDDQSRVCRVHSCSQFYSVNALNTYFLCRGSLRILSIFAARWDEFNFGAQDFGDDEPDSAGE